MTKQISLIEYFKEISGEGIQYNRSEKKIKIYDADENLLSVIFLSKSIPLNFSLQNTLGKLTKVGDVGYYVLENGHGNKNWLYTLTLTTIL